MPAVPTIVPAASQNCLFRDNASQIADPLNWLKERDFDRKRRMAEGLKDA